MIIDLIKTIVLGIVEGITEWLPISSTGHMILVNEFIKLNVSNEFWEFFEVVIQLGAILAVVVIYFKDLFPWGFGKSKDDTKNTFMLWFKIIIGCIPCGIIGILFDDWIDSHFYNAVVVGIMLILYGVLFIVIENKYKKKRNDKLSFLDAFKIGLFQVLSVIPGTSRSGATIVGGLSLGMDRKEVTNFTFYMAIPVMAGASLLKLIKFGFVFSSSEIIILLVGMFIAFVVSIISIRFLLKYIKKNDFKVFGYYRIGLGIIVLLYFLIR